MWEYGLCLGLHLRGFGRERFDRPERLTAEGLSRIGVKLKFFQMSSDRGINVQQMHAFYTIVKYTVTRISLDIIWIS